MCIRDSGKQHTIKFHVDDLMSSHIDPRVNDEFDVWLNKKYGAYGAVKGTRGICSRPMLPKTRTLASTR